MINHKTTYICFTIRRTFFNYYKSKQNPPDSSTLNSSPFSSSHDSSPLFTPNVANILKKPVIDPKINGQHYDLAIIGGGSAGIALANVKKIFIINQ